MLIFPSYLNELRFSYKIEDAALVTTTSYSDIHLLWANSLSLSVSREPLKL